MSYFSRRSGTNKKRFFNPWKKYYANSRKDVDNMYRYWKKEFGVYSVKKPYYSKWHQCWVLNRKMYQK